MHTMIADLLIEGKEQLTAAIQRWPTRDVEILVRSDDAPFVFPVPSRHDWKTLPSVVYIVEDDVEAIFQFEISSDSFIGRLRRLTA